MIWGSVQDWACGICGDRNVPDKFRVFGNCYKCAAERSIAKRDRRIVELEREEVKAQDELNPSAFESAWRAFQDTPIDFCNDSDDDEARRCLRVAIETYLQKVRT